MAKTTTTITVARSAVDGRFVTEAFAKRNPRETEVETYKKPAPTKPTGKGK